MNTETPPLLLPSGHELISFWLGQVPAPGGVYRARIPGDLETLFGPARKLRDREFLVDVDGEEWIAAPLLGLFVTWGGDHVMTADTGSIYARTDGLVTTIDFELLRKAPVA